MSERMKRGILALWSFLFLFIFLNFRTTGVARTPSASLPQVGSSTAIIKKSNQQHDSFNLKPAADLLLRPEGERKAVALASFVEGGSFEENGEIDKALEAYRKVLNVDPGHSKLASRVAALLIRQDDFPQAIDILKDAIQADPNNAEPDRQLTFRYTK